METHLNEIIALFESEPKPQINLSWLVKCSEILWENPKYSNFTLAHNERLFRIDPEIFAKITALLIRLFIQIKTEDHDKFY